MGSSATKSASDYEYVSAPIYDGTFPGSVSDVLPLEIIVTREEARKLHAEAANRADASQTFDALGFGLSHRQSTSQPKSNRNVVAASSSSPRGSTASGVGHSAGGSPHGSPNSASQSPPAFPLNA